MINQDKSLTDALWSIYRRPERPIPWSYGGNLPWDDPEFSRRMLREHLDQSHGAASRQDTEREKVIDWLWSKLELQPESRLLDVTCGPGLYSVAFAERGCQVTGVDFAPASIAYARRLAADRSVEDRCQFIESDVREMALETGAYDAATFLYGQLSVFTVDETAELLRKIAAYLQPGGRLVVELLDADRIDRQESNWWFTDDQGLWGDRPFMHLGERFWNVEQEIVVERFYTLDLENGTLDEVLLCDQSYSVERMVGLMEDAGFSNVDVYPAWGGLKLYDAQEWVVYVAHKAGGAA
jgi:SAM-dependent methyltransferase